MKNLLTRRFFLERASIASTGILLLSTTSALQALTKKENPYKGYSPYAVQKLDIRNTGIGGKHLSVTGKVYDKSGAYTKPNVLIEVWHLSPNSKRYNHKTILKTDASGRYKFITDFPNREEGRIPRIYFKVSNKEASFYTELIVNDFDAHVSGTHWVRHNTMGEKMFPTHKTIMNLTKINFNLSI